jgi:hypothetical protein
MYIMSFQTEEIETILALEDKTHSDESMKVQFSIHGQLEEWM